MNTKTLFGREDTCLPAWKRVGASLIVLGMLGGCSSVPDAVNPVEWYRSAVDIFSDDDESAATEQTEATEEQAIPGESEDFPSLSSVPERSSVEDGQAVADGLIADPNAPKYAESVTLQSSDDDVSIPATETADNVDIQLVPPAQPTIAVESEVVETTTPTIVVTETETLSVAPETVTVSSTEQVSEQIPIETAAVAPGPFSSPPLVIEPGRLPSGETYEQYRAQLMAGLQQAGTSLRTARSINNQGLSANTVVISSTGIQNTGLQNTARYSGYATLRQSGGMMTESGFIQIDHANGQPLLAPGSVKVATILFPSGSSGLNNTDRQILRKVAALQQQQGGVIRVIGHASSRTRNMDPVQHEMVNYNVSVERADRIARELVRLGAAKTQIMIGAVSDTMPIYYEVMPSGEAGNRRAEIYIDS